MSGCTSRAFLGAAVAAMLICAAAADAQTGDRPQQDRMQQQQQQERMPSEAQAQQRRPSQERASGQAPQYQPQLLDTDALIGHEVKDLNNRTLGRIDDLVLNADRTKVEYVAVTTGGLLGLGVKYVPVPWEDLAIKHSGRGQIESITANITQDQWNQLEGYAAGNWPEGADPNWRHAGPADAPADQPAATLGEGQYRRVSRIDGLRVRGSQQENLGSIVNIVLDTQEGRPVFSVVAFGGFLGLGLNYATVPWPAMEILPGADIARLDATRETIETVAYVAGNEPDLTLMSESESLYRRFNEEPYWQTFGYLEGAAGQPDHAWSAQGRYQLNFNPRRITRLQGTVVDVGAFRPIPAAAPGVVLKVRTRDDDTMIVHVGPHAYVQQQGVTFGAGQQVEVAGSRALFDGDEIIMATEIRTADQTLRLRSVDGQPLWAPQEPQPQQQDRRPSR